MHRALQPVRPGRYTHRLVHQSYPPEQHLHLNFRMEDREARGIPSIYSEILSKVVDGSKSGGLFFNSIFELDSRQYVGDQFRAVESLKASLGALA